VPLSGFSLKLMSLVQDLLRDGHFLLPHALKQLAFCTGKPAVASGESGYPDGRGGGPVVRKGHAWHLLIR
jgi:hypothetical protein